MGGLKKDTLGVLSAASLDEALKCGECLHFKQHAHSAKGGLCNTLGVRAFAVAPKCFTPDVTQIAQNSDTFVQLAALVNPYSFKQRRILLALLRQKPLKTKDIAFGTKVYFHGLGKDYISNYLSGYVMGKTSSNDLIIMGSPDVKQRGKSYIAYMNDTQHIMTAKEWKQKKAELKAAGKILDPNSRIIVKPAQVEGEPPTIDDAPQEWHDKNAKKKRVKATNVIQIS